MSTFVVEITVKGDAFFEYPGDEIARLLREVAHSVDGYGICDLPTHPRVLIDANGNTVGSFRLKGE